MEWIKCKDKLPPHGKVVRVRWAHPSPSDRKTALWDGNNWWTARRFGIYDEAPVYWLHEPPIPEPPAA